MTLAGYIHSLQSHKTLSAQDMDTLSDVWSVTIIAIRELVDAMNAAKQEPSRANNRRVWDAMTSLDKASGVVRDAAGRVVRYSH
jgi:hypothetical protein